MSFWFGALANSLLLILFVCLASLSFGTLAAWLMERTAIRASKPLSILFSLGYALPSYLLAIAWIVLANPSVGWLNHLMGPKFVNIYSLSGLVFIESSIFFSMVFLNLSTELRKTDAHLIEAATLYGASPLRIFLSIDLPLIGKELKSLALIVGLATLSSFGVAAMVGAPARIFVLTTALYSNLKQGSPEQFNEALQVAALMALLSIVVVYLSQRKKVGWSLKGQKQGAQKAILPLKKLSRNFFSIFLWSAALITMGLPMVALLLSSFQTDPSSLQLGSLGLRNWAYVFSSLPGFSGAIQSSFLISAASTLILLFLGLLHSLLQWRSDKDQLRLPKKILRGLHLASSFFYSIPGTVLALFLIYVDRKFLGGDLSDTYVILIVAMCLKYLSLSLGTLGPAIQRVDPSLIEAAEIYGAGTLQRLGYLWMPLLRPSTLTTLLLLFFPCFLEVTMSLILSGPGTENLGVLLFQLQDYADRSSAAVIATLLLVFSLMGFILHKKWDGSHRYA